MERKERRSDQPALRAGTVLSGGGQPWHRLLRRTTDPSSRWTCRPECRLSSTNPGESGLFLMAAIGRISCSRGRTCVIHTGRRRCGDHHVIRPGHAVVRDGLDVCQIICRKDLWALTGLSSWRPVAGTNVGVSTGRGCPHICATISWRTVELPAIHAQTTTIHETANSWSRSSSPAPTTPEGTTRSIFRSAMPAASRTRKEAPAPRPIRVSPTPAPRSADNMCSRGCFLQPASTMPAGSAGECC